MRAYAAYNSRASSYYSAEANRPRPRTGRKSAPSVKAIRFFAFVVVLLAAFTMGMMVQAFAGNDRSDLGGNPGTLADDEIAQAKLITVMPGDTLWELAARHAPEGTALQKYVYELKQLNDLKSGMIRIGQILQLPD